MKNLMKQKMFEIFLFSKKKIIRLLCKFKNPQPYPRMWIIRYTTNWLSQWIVFFYLHFWRTNGMQRCKRGYGIFFFCSVQKWWQSITHINKQACINRNDMNTNFCSSNLIEASMEYIVPCKSENNSYRFEKL